MVEAYQGVVKNGTIILSKQIKIKNGTPVLVILQVDSENKWLSVTKAARRYQVTADLVRQWMESGKIRIHANNPKLVNASDVEDAADQYELVGLSMKVMERDE